MEKEKGREREREREREQATDTIQKPLLKESVVHVLIQRDALTLLPNAAIDHYTLRPKDYTSSQLTLVSKGHNYSSIPFSLCS